MKLYIFIDFHQYENIFTVYLKNMYLKYAKQDVDACACQWEAREQHWGYQMQREN